MRKTLYSFPVVVLLSEYIAVKSSIAYAEGIADYEKAIVDLLGGLVRIGDNVAYDAVPNLVFTLHSLALFLSIVFFVYYAFVFEKSELDTVTEKME